MNIYCDQFDFSPLAEAFDGEVESDCGLSAEIVLVEAEEIRQIGRAHV